jgi:hypothetical protein
MSEANWEKPKANEPTKLSNDARGLGPRVAGGFAIGHVDEIVGDGGLEVPGFVATKKEILQIVRYWAMEIVHLDWFFSCTAAQDRPSGAPENLPTGA